jgi:endoglucanase
LNGFVGTICAALVAFVALTFPEHTPVPHSAPIEPGVPSARLTKLRRGINTSHWFAQLPNKQGYNKSHFDTHTTAGDIALIKAMGFDHIRFGLEIGPMFDSKTPENIPTQYLAYIDHAIDTMLTVGLAVVVDIHPSDEFKKNLADDKHVDAFGKFWGAFATHLSTRDPERVFLEVINEPMVEDGYRWMGIQTKLIAAIRAAAPRHTIIATAHRWSSPGEFLFLEPVADPNVIYNFHFYEPHLFTHQGATWGWELWRYLQKVPYPSSPEAIAPILPTIGSERLRAALVKYGEERWGPARIEREIAAIGSWAKRHNVHVTCNEFGVYRKVVSAVDRAAWIRDARTAMEKHGIGWTMWDYQGGFNVVNRVDGRVVPDPEIIAALGLKPSS